MGEKKTTNATGGKNTEKVSEHVYVQFEEKEVKTSELVEEVKEIWKAEGHRIASIKSLDLYIKPEDKAAYYVINGKTTGRLEL